MHHHHGHRGHHMMRPHHGQHGKMGFGRHGGHHRRGHPLIDGDCHKGKMKMKFGRHHRPCMHGFDEFHPHMGEMSRFGNHGMMKCRKGNHQHKGKHMLKEFFRMMMASSSESDESDNEETDQEATQGTGQIPTMEAGQEATQTGESGGKEEHAGRRHHGRIMRCGRHHHGCSKDKFKMKFGKGDGHKDKVIWKCKKNKFQHKGGEGCKSMRAMFMDTMCSGRRREMWDGFIRMMTEQEIDTGVEGQKDLPNEETNQEETGQTSSIDIDATGAEESNLKDPQSSGAKDRSV